MPRSLNDWRCDDMSLLSLLGRGDRSGDPKFVCLKEGDDALVSMFWTMLFGKDNANGKLHLPPTLWLLPCVTLPRPHFSTSLGTLLTVRGLKQSKGNY
jgi:hypothetical protein